MAAAAQGEQRAALSPAAAEARHTNQELDERDKAARELEKNERQRRGRGGREKLTHARCAARCQGGGAFEKSGRQRARRTPRSFPPRRQALKKRRGGAGGMGRALGGKGAGGRGSAQGRPAPHGGGAIPLLMNAAAGPRAGSSSARRQKRCALRRAAGATRRHRREGAVLRLSGGTAGSGN